MMDSNALLFTSYRLIYTSGSVRIKGQYRIASYEDTLLVIKCSNDNICVSGENIIITLLSNDEIHICGKISDISFA